MLTVLVLVSLFRGGPQSCAGDSKPSTLHHGQLQSYFADGAFEYINQILIVLCFKPSNGFPLHSE